LRDDHVDVIACLSGIPSLLCDLASGREVACVLNGKTV
jgi:hypothetical protein